MSSFSMTELHVNRLEWGSNGPISKISCCIIHEVNFSEVPINSVMYFLLIIDGVWITFCSASLLSSRGVFMLLLLLNLLWGHWHACLIYIGDDTETRHHLEMTTHHIHLPYGHICCFLPSKQEVLTQCCPLVGLARTNCPYMLTLIELLLSAHVMKAIKHLFLMLFID